MLWSMESMSLSKMILKSQTKLNPLDIMEGPLMDGIMLLVIYLDLGRCFFLRLQVCKVMKQSVAYLLPYMESENTKNKIEGKILLATLKGDVHDIGKNIVGVVLQCNNFEIIDLGVMVPANKIIETAIKENVDLIGLSGLITPVWMKCFVASELERNNVNKPLLIGGATTSKIHTAIKIDPYIILSVM